MTPRARPSGRLRESLSNVRDTIRRAFAEFLAVPTGIILGFLILAIGLNAIDRRHIAWLEPSRMFLRVHVFVDARATSDLLSTIASGIITVTSITISLLLLALQQSAASMTSEVFDQFLRRRVNQVYFGFFVGLALYALVTLATVGEPFNPVFGATAAFLLTVVALYLLILLLYTTINQMRPVEIIAQIHNHILAARARQLSLVHRTRRASRSSGTGNTMVRSVKHGFVTRIDLTALDAALGQGGRGERGDHSAATAEVALRVSIGSHVAFDDVIAEISATTAAGADVLGPAVAGAVRIERERDIIADPAYGIEQLETIAWTSVSTSKSNPAPGLLTIRSLRDVLARWCAEPPERDPAEPVPVVYVDNTVGRLFDAFETIAVVSSESMQHQTYTEVVRTFTVMYDRLPSDQRRRAEDLIMRILSALGDHVLTAELDAALNALGDMLARAGRVDTAAAVRAARAELATSFGKLNSRATRTPTGR